MKYSRAKQTFHWFCINRQTGEITIGQKPNALLITTLAAFVARFLLQEFNGPSFLVDIAKWAAPGLLLLFGLDELFRGVNPWRRIMGAGLCLLAIVSLSKIWF